MYKEKLKEYKRTCSSNRNSYWQKKFDLIEKSLRNPKLFWANWKNCSEDPTRLQNSRVSGVKWFNHFSSLHSDSSTNINLVGEDMTSYPQDAVLNRPFTKKEFETVIMGLKTGKACGFDQISNEMLKNFPNNILDLLLQYINLCLKKSLIGKSLCLDLINPIHKEGDKSDPNNYRGICISSAILKLITSLIYERFLKYVENNNLLSKNQIGFKRNGRTSDHLLTLKTVMKKYVTRGHKKIYACFVDLKKAFDSVPHNLLFNKLRHMGLAGNMLSLIENIYDKTNCAVKGDGNKITQFFDFTKGVRQGCPLSPLLFNLYINGIVKKIDDSRKVSIKLDNSTFKLNVLLYADDIVILAESENELQNSLNELSRFCELWKLSINPSKTKCIVFNRGNRLCRCKIYVEGILLENVKSIKYLGFTLHCNLKGIPENLSIKANRAILSLNNRIKLSRIPPWLSLKIFNSQIKPILLYGS